MIIYCDSLTVGACIQIIKLNWQELSCRNECVIQILDPIFDRSWSAFLRLIMKLFGFRINEAEFFTGHLRTADQQIVYTASISASRDLAMRAVKRVFKSSRFLSRLNEAWGRNTIFKNIVGSLELPSRQITLKILTAEALGGSVKKSKKILVVRHRFPFGPDLLQELSPSLIVCSYRSWSREVLKRGRLSVVLLLIYAKLCEIIWFFSALVDKKTNQQKASNIQESTLPSLLVLQEDDLSKDRSYRTQPHWLFKEDGKTPFKTIILLKEEVDRLPVDRKAMEEQNITTISKKDLYRLSRPFGFVHPVQKRLTMDIWECMVKSLLGSPEEICFLLEVVMLLYVAHHLAAFCKRNRVKAFMTCENYMMQADAVQLISSDLDITTLSYQYANGGKVRPHMMTTADIMLTFAPRFHPRWVDEGINPQRFINIGYPYDGSFKYLHPRASLHRDSLEKSGAKFIICYFDESTQAGKYGLVSIKDHCTEIMSLLDLVIQDPSLGLIIKTQFQRNTPRQLKELSHARVAAQTTGRYLELSHGATRNIVFPAEAALAADMVIGHAIGATAPLEAALVGSRSILLNNYEIKSDNDFFYAQADIVYLSIEAALDAIHGFRRGEPECSKLGDWSAIIDQFDSFRDGGAGHRLRNLLEQAVLHGKISCDYPEEMNTQCSYAEANVR